MLVNLHVKNLALIDEADVYFGEGLNILTGETGAGKSIILGSVQLALGGKASADIIREGSSHASVELVFQIDKKQKQLLSEMDIIVDEDGMVILSRKLMPGRSISKVNGETVTVTSLRRVSEILIDIHGQHEHQSLLNKKKHLEILDEFAKEELLPVKAELKECYQDYVDIKKKLEESLLDEEERIRELSFAEFECNEIAEAALVPGEDEQLEETYRKLGNARKIIDAVTQVHQLTGYEDGSSAGDSIGRALRELNSVVGYDSVLENMVSQLTDVDGLLNDFNRELSDYISDLTFSQEDFGEIEKRLNHLNQLKAKYGKTIEAVIAYGKEKEKRAADLRDYDLYIETCRKQADAAKAKLEAVSVKATEVRRKYAGALEKQISEALLDLNFLDVVFEIEIRRKEEYSANGWDDAEFLISTNPGEPVKPLGRIASGGELSRIMLAVKTVLADRDQIGTLIFDEIDVGISGRTAQKVSEKMALIAGSCQVICITHLAQIAAMADTHFAIEKNVKNNETITSIYKLSEQQQVEELARILGGAEITGAVTENAVEMKRLAGAKKKSIR